VDKRPWMKAGVAFLVGLACAGAGAQERHVAVFGAIGTGIGFGVATPINERFNVRADAMFGRLNRDFSTDTVDYEGRFRLKNLGVYADWVPFNNAFRASLGAVYARTTADLVGRPRGGTLTVGNTTVNAAGESISATVRMKRLRPYVGIGWGLANLNAPGFTWGIDLGAIIGRPDVERFELSPGLAAAVPAADVELERQRLRNDVRKLRAEPVLKVSVGYVF
jgi:hypothetical protein